MTQEELIRAEVPIEKLDLLTREELVQFYKLEQKYRIQLEKRVKTLESLNEELKQKSFRIEGLYVTIKNKFFGKSSEKLPVRSVTETKNEKTEALPKAPRILLPSERYPDAPLIERDITLDQLPSCRSCGEEMEDSGLTEDSEQLTVIPAQYLVVRNRRHTYRCGGCHGDLQTAPALPRIKEGSSYSDEMIVDASLSKYCDLIPIERYSSIAGRSGMPGIPPQSLIESTHYLSEFVRGAYDKLKEEVLASKVLHADETPHRMLEGDSKSSWFLWGFTAPSIATYFECHPTRSGDVASELMTDSACEFLVSDVYSGYGKAVRETNIVRTSKGAAKIQNAFCNAHARRRFKEASERYPDDADFFFEHYQKIYRIEAELKEKPPDEIRRRRRTESAALFRDMKERALELLPAYPTKSSMGRAISYFLENWQGFTLFLEHPEIPIDNNPQERLLRNPVIGRKTWYGTHSKQGAKTMAILFSIVESCKLNGVNPRLYFKNLIADLHAGKTVYTPRQFKFQ